MIETTVAGSGLVRWRLPLYAVLGTFIVFIPIAVGQSSDISLFLYILVAIPIISLFLLIYAVLKKGRRRLSILSLLVVYWAVSVALVANYSAIRDTSRWLVWSHDYKVEILAQPASANGELKHVEWDGWGFPGAGDTTVHLVFDPTDTLSAAAGAIDPANSMAYPARYLLYVVWGAIGAPFGFTPMNGGADGID
jgi:hypothetical protein